jgi:hypothetical protein
VDLQAIRTSVDTRTKNLLETITDTRKHFHVEVGLMVQGEEQMTKSLIDTAPRGLEVKMAEVEALVERGRGKGTGAGAAKLPEFNGTTSWAVFRRQPETVAEYNCWTRLEISTYFITPLQGRATDVLHGVPKGATYEEALEDPFGDQHLATAYRSRLKSRTQGVGKSMQECSIFIEQLAHRAYPALSEDHVRREAGQAFADGLQDLAVNIQLLLGGKKTVNEALREPSKCMPCTKPSGPTKRAPEHSGGAGRHHRAKRHKKIGMLELCGARPLHG